MANSKVLHQIADFLRPEHFADAANGRIYQECTRRIMAGGVADAVSLRLWWESDADSGSVLGKGYLAQLLASMVSLVSARDYARVIVDCWMRREILHTASLLAQAAQDTSKSMMDDVHSATAEIDRAVAGIADQSMPIHSFNNALDDAISDAEARYRGEPSNAIFTGMQTVDDAIGGFEPGTMIVLAGATGMGKSALGWSWATGIAKQARELMRQGASLIDVPGVAGISLEMTAKQLARRAISAATEISVTDIKRGAHLNEADWAQISRARRVDLADLPLEIVDSSGLTVQQIRLRLRAIRRKIGLGLIVVDHLHIVVPEDRDVRNGSTAAVGKVSEAMMHLAKEFNVPLLCLAQLSRGIASREDKRPTKADLRQSGEIEQNADTIAFVHRPEYFIPKARPEQKPGELSEAFHARLRDDDEMRDRTAGKAELILAKVRDGDETIVPLTFHGPTTTFHEVVSFR